MGYTRGMAGKIFNKAKRCLSLRETRLFEDNKKLGDALLVAVIHGVHVLYQREEQQYYFIRIAGMTYELMLMLAESKKLGLDDLVAIVEEHDKIGMKI